MQTPTRDAVEEETSASVVFVAAVALTEGPLGNARSGRLSLSPRAVSARSSGVSGASRKSRLGSRVLAASGASRPRLAASGRRLGRRPASGLRLSRVSRVPRVWVRSRGRLSWSWVRSRGGLWRLFFRVPAASRVSGASRPRPGASWPRPAASRNSRLSRLGGVCKTQRCLGAPKWTETMQSLLGPNWLLY